MRDDLGVGIIIITIGSATLVVTAISLILLDAVIAWIVASIIVPLQNVLPAGLVSSYRSNTDYCC